MVIKPANQPSIYQVFYLAVCPVCPRLIDCGKKRDLRLLDVTPDKMDKWGLLLTAQVTTEKEMLTEGYFLGGLQMLFYF